MIKAQRGSLRSVSWAPALSVVADLTVSVDDNCAHLSSDGRELVLTADNPLAFWNAISTAELPAAVGSISGPRALGRAADLLSDMGTTFRLVGPRGELVRLGARGKSPLMRVVTGSSSIELGEVRAVLPIVRGWLGQTVSKQWRLATAVAAGVAVLVIARKRLIN